MYSIIIIILLTISFPVKANDAQLSFCEFIEIQTCRNSDADCESGWTPAQVKAHLNRTPTAVLTIPGKFVDGFLHIYVANSGGVVVLQFRKHADEYRIFKGDSSYSSWIGNNQPCTVRVHT